MSGLYRVATDGGGLRHFVVDPNEIEVANFQLDSGAAWAYAKELNGDQITPGSIEDDETKPIGAGR